MLCDWLAMIQCDRINGFSNVILSLPWNATSGLIKVTSFIYYEKKWIYNIEMTCRGKKHKECISYSLVQWTSSSLKCDLIVVDQTATGTLRDSSILSSIWNCMGFLSRPIFTHSLNRYFKSPGRFVVQFHPNIKVLHRKGWWWLYYSSHQFWIRG